MPRVVDSQISIYLESKTLEPKLETVAQAVRLSISNQLNQISAVKVYEEKVQLPLNILEMDKVELLSIRRQTGLDGLIKIAVANHPIGTNTLVLKINLADFSAGQIVYSQNLEGNFGTDLLAKIETQVSQFLSALIHYYDAKLSVTSNPSPAEIWLNDQQVDQTPSHNLTVSANQSYQLEIRKKGYATHRRMVEIQSGQHLLIDVLLYDKITNQLLQKQRHLDSMNFSLGPQLHFYPLNQSTLKTLPVNSFRYLSKFGPWQVGLDLSSANWEGKQKIDTVLGQDTGQSSFTFQINRFVFLSQYNLIERVNQFDLYAGLHAGIATSRIDYQIGPVIKPAEQTLAEVNTTNPIAGIEIGSRLYLGHQLKLQLLVGAEFGGTTIYYQKQTNYWGASTYQKRSTSLNRLYCGLIGTYSLWPKYKK